MILKCYIRNKQIDQIAFIPTLFGRNGQPEILVEGTEEFGEVLKLMKKLSGELGVELSVQGGEVVVPNSKSREIDTRDLMRRSKISYPSLRWIGT